MRVFTYGGGARDTEARGFNNTRLAAKWTAANEIRPF